MTSLPRTNELEGSGSSASRWFCWWLFFGMVTLQEINISHLGKGKIIFKYALSGGYVNSLEGKSSDLLEKVNWPPTIGNRKGHELNHLAETAFPWFWLSALPELLDIFFQAPPENSAMGTRKVDAQPSYCCSKIRLYNHLRFIQDHVNNDRFSISTGDRRIFEPSIVFEAGDTFSKGPSILAWHPWHLFLQSLGPLSKGIRRFFFDFLLNGRLGSMEEPHKRHSFKGLYFINNL